MIEGIADRRGVLGTDDRCGDERFRNLMESTDVIAGFPGERTGDFEDTVALVRALPLRLA